MRNAEFDDLCADIDDATYGFLESLAALWGHSIKYHGNLGCFDDEGTRYKVLDCSAFQNKTKTRRT